jgi:hypothetical protein
MSCTIKDRLIVSIKQDIKQNATSYKFEDVRVFIPSFKNNLQAAFKIGEKIVNKINNKYKYWSNGDIVSLDTTPKDGVYINIHPTKDLIDVYEREEAIKDIELSEKENESIIIKEGILMSKEQIVKELSPEELYNNSLNLTDEEINERIKKCE